MADDKKPKRTRNWVFIVYPESAPEDWRQILRSEQVPGVISPLHDRDVNPDGEKKKPHWHVLLTFCGVKARSQVEEITKKLNATVPLVCKDIRGTCRYLCHMDNPEKAQYDPNDIECLGGFDYLTKVSGAADVDEAVREMMAWCNGNQCDSFYWLSNYAAENRPDWFRVITTQRTMFMSAWLKSYGWERKQRRTCMDFQPASPYTGSRQDGSEREPDAGDLPTFEDDIEGKE